MMEEAKSRAEEGLQWKEVEEDGGLCRRHAITSQVAYGACPVCLHDRLMRLCPDCAHVRPCQCMPSTSASSSTASSSFSSCGSGRATGNQFGNGSDKISDLIASEPAFVRSKSVGFVMQRTGSVKIGLDRSRSVATGGERKKRRWAWAAKAAIWPLKMLKPIKGEDKVEKWKWWYFASPSRVFNYRKSASRTVV